MSDFLNLLESELQEFELFEEEEVLLDMECLLDLDEEEAEEIREELGLTVEEFEDLLESTTRRVSSSGQIKRIPNKKRRTQRARQTTGMSKTERKRRAVRAARTRKRNPGSVRKAVRKRKRAMRKRRSLNI